MNFKKLVTGSLALAIIFSNVPTNLFKSFANTSLDVKYEDFQGDDYSVDNLVKGTDSEFEIEGHTMINIFDYSKMSPITPALSSLGFSINGREITRNYTMALDSQENSFLSSDEYVIKNGETYTLVVDITENTLDTRIEAFPYVWKYAEWSKGDVCVNPGYRGKIIISFKAKKDSILSLLYKHSDQTITGSITISDIMLLKGDYYDSFTNGDIKIPEYFEGSKSVGEDEGKIEIVSKNKNLLDINNLQVMNYSHDLPYKETGLNIAFNTNEDTISYSLTTGWNIGVGGVYKVKKNTLYTAKYEEATCDKNYNMSINILGLYENELDVTYWDDNNYQKYTSRFLNIKKGPNEKNVSLTYNSKNYDYIVFYIGGAWKLNPSETRNITLKNVGIYEAGNSDIEYERYSQNKEEILLSEPLRGIPGGAKDRILKKNGQWVIERNVGRAIIDGSENWFLTTSDNGIRFFEEHNGLNKKHYHKSSASKLLSDKLLNKKIYYAMSKNEYKDFIISTDLNSSHEWRIATTQDMTLDEFRGWLATNKPEVYYELETPVYESIKKDLSLYLYPDMSYISSNSNISANIKITVDRILNRVIKSIKEFENNPTVENLSIARMWVNLLDESIEKDYFQNELNSSVDINNIALERKNTTANVDVYIKSQNMLSLSLSTNNITFEGYSGVEDVEKLNAVNLTVSSSLPYKVNAYLASEIQNSDKSNVIDKSILNIKANSDVDYKEFIDTVNPITLLDNQSKGSMSHGIDLKLKSDLAHKADVYKTTLKFEVEQK